MADRKGNVFTETQNYDIIIIGAGAGGGTLASYLAHSGKKILVIDRRAWLPREKRNWDVINVMVDGVYENGDQWLNKEGEPYHSNAHYNVGAIRSVGKQPCSGSGRGASNKSVIQTVFRRNGL